MNNMYSVHINYVLRVHSYFVFIKFIIYLTNVPSDCVNLVKKTQSAEFEELCDRIDVNMKYNL